MGMDLDLDLAKLKADIADRGWLAEDLARKAKVHKATVSRVLAGLRANPRTVARLARAMGYTVRRYRLKPEAKVA